MPILENQKFSLNSINEETAQLCNEILKEYIKIPSVEIWSNETITSLLYQIEYYWDCQLFEKEDDALKLCEHVETLLNHIKKQAELGAKFEIDKNPVHENNFKMYWNEVVLPDNTIITKTNGKLITHLSHDVMNYLITTNESFSELTLGTLNNVIKRSLLISEVSEKSRNMFFRSLFNKLNKLKSKIED